MLAINSASLSSSLQFSMISGEYAQKHLLHNDLFSWTFLAKAESCAVLLRQNKWIKARTVADCWSLPTFDNIITFSKSQHLVKVLFLRCLDLTLFLICASLHFDSSRHVHHACITHPDSSWNWLQYYSNAWSIWQSEFDCYPEYPPHLSSSFN